MMSERRLLVKVEAQRYRTARKKEKGWILDELVALSGHNRWYAVGLLRGQGKAIKVGRRLRLVMSVVGHDSKSCHTQIYRVRDILAHLGEVTAPPRMMSARGPPLWEMLDAGQGENDPQVQPAPDYEFDQRIAW